MEPGEERTSGVVDVDDLAGLDLWPLRSDVLHDPHDLPGLLVDPVDDEPLAERGAVGPVAVGHGPVDHDRLRRLGVVSVGEVPPLQELDAHGGEVVAGHVPDVGSGPVLGSRWWSVVWPVAGRGTEPIHGQEGDSSRGGHARRRLDPGQQFVEEGGPACGVAVRRPAQIHPPDEHVFGLDPVVDGQKSRKAACQQGRARKEHDGHGDLEHDERVPHPAALARGPPGLGSQRGGR